MQSFCGLLIVICAFWSASKMFSYDLQDFLSPAISDVHVNNVHSCQLRSCKCRSYIRFIGHIITVSLICNFFSLVSFFFTSFESSSFRYVFCSFQSIFNLAYYSLNSFISLVRPVQGKISLFTLS
jgi:hypothetical protein